MDRAATAAGSPAPRPLAGSIGPVATAVGDDVGTGAVGYGETDGPATDGGVPVGLWKDGVGKPENDGVGATRGPPEPPSDGWGERGSDVAGGSLVGAAEEGVRCGCALRTVSVPSSLNTSVPADIACPPTRFAG
jgi:hypothetical protein